MKSELHKLVNESEMNEMGIRRVERLSGSHIGRERQQTIDYQRQRSRVPERRSYEEVAIELKRALKNVRRLDITMEKPGGSRTYYPRFPQNIVDLLQELKQIDERRMQNDFGRWRDAYPDNSSTVHFNTDGPDSFQRSHFPDGGIQPSLRGINLGYKLYRTLLKTAGYLSSNSAGTREKDKAWGSLLSYKQNADGTPSEDDAHAVIGPGNWMAIDKGYRDKVAKAMDFIERSISFSNTTPDKFDMDDELLAQMPDAFLSRLSQQYLRSLVDDNRIPRDKFEQINAAASEAQRLEAERQRRREEEERERRANQERELRARFAERIRRYGADLDADWNVGDFIVVKSYLLQDYDNLPIRQVAARNGNNYVAVYVRDAMAIANGQMSVGNAGDTRTTSDKSAWAKVNLEDIPDLGRVSLNQQEREYVESLLTPERRQEMADRRQRQERERLDAEAAANAQRAQQTQTYGQIINNQRELNDAMASRSQLPNSSLIAKFRSGNAVQVIAMAENQLMAARSRTTDVFVPFIPTGRSGRPVGIDEIRTNPGRISLLNLVTGHVIQPPLTGLALQFFTLDEVTRDEKRQVRGGDLFYIANHRNVYGVVSRAEYGTRNTADQPFIYMNVMGAGTRGTAVRLDLLRKISAPMTFEQLIAGGAGGNR